MSDFIQRSQNKKLRFRHTKVKALSINWLGPAGKKIAVASLI